MKYNCIYYLACLYLGQPSQPPFRDVFNANQYLYYIIYQQVPAWNLSRHPLMSLQYMYDLHPGLIPEDLDLFRFGAVAERLADPGIQAWWLQCVPGCKDTKQSQVTRICMQS